MKTKSDMSVQALTTLYAKSIDGPGSSTYA